MYSGHGVAWAAVQDGFPDEGSIDGGVGEIMVKKLRKLHEQQRVPPMWTTGVRVREGGHQTRGW